MLIEFSFNATSSSLSYASRELKSVWQALDNIHSLPHETLIQLIKCTNLKESVLMLIGLILQMSRLRMLFCSLILLKRYTDVGGWLRLASMGRGRMMKKESKNGVVVLVGVACRK